MMKQTKPTPTRIKINTSSIHKVGYSNHIESDKECNNHI